MESANADSNECVEAMVEAVQAVQEEDSKELVRLQTNALEQTPTVPAESCGLEREDPATPGNTDASGYPLAGEREDVPPEELETYGGVGYSFEGQDQCDEEPEEPEDSPANDGLLEATSERLGSRVRGMVEKAGEGLRNVFQKNENLVLRATALRHDVLQHNDQQMQKFDIIKNMLLDSLKKYSKDGE